MSSLHSRTPKHREALTGADVESIWDAQVGTGRVEFELLKFREYQGYALYDGAGFGLIIPVVSGVVTPVSLGLTAMRGPDETIYFTFEGARVAGAMGARLWIGKCWKE